jgi:hypothetical protein
MKRFTQRLAQILLQIVRALEGYRDLFLAWLDGIVAHLFPTPVKVRVPNQRPSRSRGRKPRR